MKNIFLLTFVLILSACAAPQPQVTVTRFAEVTVTLPPLTETVIPTPTVPPAFLSIQEQVAGDTQNYTIMGNGQIEGKLPDGTIGVINGITLNPDGASYTITVNGAEVTIGIDKVSISDENGVQIEGYEDPDGDGDFSERFNLTKWAGTDETRIEFVDLINTIGYPAENITCDDKGVCKNTEGSTIWSEGEFDMAFVKAAVIEYGDAKATPYGPSTGNVPPGTATDEVLKNVTFPMVQKVGKLLKEQNGGEDVLTHDGAFSQTMISDIDNSWSVIITIDRFDPDSDKYFAYEKEGGELVVIPMK